MASIIKRTYVVRGPDGKKVRKSYKHWTIQWRDESGRIRRKKGYTDKTATKQLAAKLEKSQARGEQDMVDPFRVHRRAPIAGHMKDYVADLVASGCDDKYVENQRNRLNRLVKECRWTCLDDITSDSFVRWREGERRSDTLRRGALSTGAAATTLNQYLDVGRAFTNWCATHHRMAGVPIGSGKMMAVALSGVGKVDGEKRRKRRALTEEQLMNLLAVAPDRALVYRFGIASGLRRQELEDLVWGDIRLNAINPYVKLRAEATKARRADRVDLAPTLAQALRDVKPAKAKDSDRVFDEVPSIVQWRDDLAAAGIAYKDDMGRQLDFHGGCRQTLCTRMHTAGVPQREAMRRLRVTDPKLLNDIYADDEQLAAASSPLPEVLPKMTTAKTGVVAG